MPGTGPGKPRIFAHRALPSPDAEASTMELPSIVFRFDSVKPRSVPILEDLANNTCRMILAKSADVACPSEMMPDSHEV